MAAAKASLARCISGMVLAGVGDAMGFVFEFHYDGKFIHKAVSNTGIKNIHCDGAKMSVSDDTVMHLATAEGILEASPGASFDDVMSSVATHYIKCMDDMSGRAAGSTSIQSTHKIGLLRQKDPKAYKIPFSGSAGGCGAAMRAQCIGMRFPRESELQDLIKYSIETSRMTHHHPTGYLGGLVSALFSSYALQDQPINMWGYKLVKEVLPQAKKYVKEAGDYAEENLNKWNYFENKWNEYLELRKINKPNQQPVFPDSYGQEERDEYYSSISWSGWGGSSGHDSVIIAYDALLGCKGSWDELCMRAIYHAGDNDSTGGIAACWYGLMYGMEGVYELNHRDLEYRERLVKAAEGLYKLSQLSQPSATEL